MNERECICAFLRATADYWRRQKPRLRLNKEAVFHCDLKADLLEAVAKDIEAEEHLK